MLIRRIATAFRNQDWATVTIEFMVVVAGIFVGLQADSAVASTTEKFVNQNRSIPGISLESLELVDDLDCCFVHAPQVGNNTLVY